MMSENNYYTRFVLELPEMQEQHLYLYRLFDTVKTIKANIKTRSTDLLIKEIERYTLFHFASEEQLMKLYSDPSFSIHQSDHEHMSIRLIKFMDDYESEVLNPVAMHIFLTGWLMEHSIQSDDKYVKWIQECRRDININK